VAVLGAAFQIGRSALAAYQAAIAVTGQNVANVGNPNYARQTGHLDALPGAVQPAGISPGTGVSMSTLERHVDEALEGRLRLALAQREGANTKYQALNQVETLYSELTDHDLSSQLNDLFSSFANLQTDPLEPTARDQVIAKADAVIDTMQRQRSGLLTQISDLNDQTEAAVRDINAKTAEIADLNQRIVASGASGTGGDSALRDRRDTLLQDLAKLMDVQTREQQNGIVNVYVGSEPLVEYSRARSLTTKATIADGVQRAEVRFADNNGTVPIHDGQLAAIADARDTHLAGQLGQLDQLAKGLIYEVNRVHSAGQGLVGYTSISGTYAVGDAVAPLNSAAASLPFPVQNGTFLVQVRDQNSGQTTTRMIKVDLNGLPDAGTPGGGDTSLNVLARVLGEVPGLHAAVTADNRIQVDADAGLQVSFSEDTSGALAALGIGTFFAGTDASTLAVNAAVRSDPQLIATSLNGAPGDGSNAGCLAAAGTTASTLLGGRSVQDYQASMVNRLAVDTAAAKTTYDASDAVYSGLSAQREAVSGVNLDEETINLTMFEQAFQGVSRYVNVLNTLSDSVLALVQ